jgi:hypothetical protein
MVAGALVLLALLGIIGWTIYDLMMRRVDRQHPGQPRGWFAHEWRIRYSSWSPPEAFAQWWDDWHRTGITPADWIENPSHRR